MTVSNLVQIAVTTLATLEQIHNLGYIHLDIKPQNIVLGKQYSGKVDLSSAVIVDYGLAV